MSAFDVRLRRTAVDFILPTGLDVGRAVALAEDMLASGVENAATVEVAMLAGDSLVSDAEGLVRDMLAELGIVARSGMRVPIRLRTTGARTRVLDG